jgi:hypothetical protein
MMAAIKMVPRAQLVDLLHLILDATNQNILPKPLLKNFFNKTENPSYELAGKNSNLFSKSNPQNILEIRNLSEIPFRRHPKI